MIGELGEDKKADWPLHMAEIVYAYNAIQSTVTGYIPHYLMFGRRPRLPVNFVFPTIGSFHLRPAEDYPVGGASPVSYQSTQTEMVL